MAASLFELQREQLAHDRAHHRDVMAMSRKGRLFHYLIHLAKYTGRVATLSDDLDHKQKEPRELERLPKTLVDITIITMALANLFDVDLEASIRKRWAEIAAKKKQ